MGAQHTIDAETDQGITFLLGSDKAHVLILKPDDMTRRNTVLEAVLNLSTMRSGYQLLYLAAPRLFGTSVDASIFSSRGIGLLLYDERRIDEAVAAHPLRIEQTARHSLQDEKTLVTELEALKAMYLEMDRTMNQMRNDLTALRNLGPVHSQTAGIPVATQLITTQRTFPQTAVQGAELPSYFANNPWLDVLSKRGTGAREPIAC
jgi:hypothetical protein